MVRRDWYVYAHYKKSSAEIFYIGIGASPNFGRAYTRSCRSNLWARNAKKYGFVVGILDFCLTVKQAKSLEIKLIKYYGRIHNGGPLVNMTNGGDGTEGYIFTEAHLKKLRDAHKKRPPEFQQKVTANLMLYNKSRKGVPRPDIGLWNKKTKTGVRYKQSNPCKKRPWQSEINKQRALKNKSL